MCIQAFWRMHFLKSAQCDCGACITKGAYPNSFCSSSADYSPYPEEPCPEGTFAEPCPEAETYTDGYVEGYAEGLPEGYEYSSEGVDPEYEPSPEESSLEELQQEATDATYDEGYTEGSAEGYSAGYEIGEYGLATPEELSPEYSSSGRAQMHEKQPALCLLQGHGLSLHCCELAYCSYTPAWKHTKACV